MTEKYPETFPEGKYIKFPITVSEQTNDLLVKILDSDISSKNTPYTLFGNSALANPQNELYLSPTQIKLCNQALARRSFVKLPIKRAQIRFNVEHGLLTKEEPTQLRRKNKRIDALVSGDDFYIEKPTKLIPKFPEPLVINFFDVKKPKNNLTT